ncbi:MAG: hypothetical protein A2474_02530 [Elusimicrobia bacterium RIFOXYC2_FULL_34_12]|nr:MAG: hypothetical protein A2474_02530 [Elusimicrobia bacterium RIFOXYC2_FULL_34_12]HAM39675.1 hypothetical protein [Elusimicrobiota bacterium]
MIIIFAVHIKNKLLNITLKTNIATSMDHIVETFGYMIMKEDIMSGLNKMHEYAKNIVIAPETEYIIFYDKNDDFITYSGRINYTKVALRTDNILKLKSDIYNVHREIKGKEGLKIGSINVGFNIRIFNEIIKSNLTTGIIIYSVSSFIIVIIFYFLLNIFLKPLKSLYNAARCVSKKNFNCFVPVSKKDELGEISEQFNIMISELNNFYNNLEEQVQNATDDVRMLNAKLIERSMELDKINKQLIELDKKKSNFISIVAHDLRTPLTSIMGYADTLLNKKLKISEHNRIEYLNIIQTESHRLSRLISDFLDISKMETGIIKLYKEEVDIVKITKETIANINMILKSNSIILESDKNIGSVEIDKDRIIQVLQNIIWNAIKFSPKGSVIKVNISNHIYGIRVDVFDKGPGIADEFKEKIFEKFFTIEDDVVRKKTGTGLGLSIAHTIVELHGGKIWVENNISGGSCFSFLIPHRNEDKRVS